MSKVADFQEISISFTDYEKTKEERCDLPNRCLVRYRMGNGEWKSFWERSRFHDNSEEKGDDYPWKQEDEKRVGEGEAHEYAIRRLELILNPTDDEDKDPYTRQPFKGCFRSNKFTYYFNTKAIHYHYKVGRVVTVNYPVERRVEVKYPVNLMLNGEGSLICCHPVDVAVLHEGKEEFETAFDSSSKKPNMVVFENIDTYSTIGYQRWFWDDRSLKKLPEDYNSDDRMEVEMYFNNAPAFRGRDLTDFLSDHPNVFIHAKYGYFKDNRVRVSRTKMFDSVNENPGFPLFITPFTDGDWKVLQRHILQLAEQQMAQKMKDVGISTEEKKEGDNDKEAIE